LFYTSVWLPLIVVVAHAWLTSKQTFQWLETSAALSAVCMAIGLCEGTTQILKLWIQRRRPNFYALCEFDKQLLKCTAPLERLREANFSFPSGHSSLACCGMTFLAWYFLGKNNNKGKLSGFAIAAVPWGWAIFVGASRLVDRWHHPSDVLAGLGLGFATCTIVYHTWYPPVWSQHAGIPRILLQEPEIKNKLPSFNQ
jgi:membrane-associated phospholipid phosphatase